MRLTALIGGGALVLAPFALLETLGGAIPDFGDPRLYAALGLLAIIPSLGAYFCYDRLVRQVGATGASVSMYLVPLCHARSLASARRSPQTVPRCRTGADPRRRAAFGDVPGNAPDPFSSTG